MAQVKEASILAHNTLKAAPTQCIIAPMMQRKQKQTLLAASLLSWLILFALPFASGPLNNGTEWVQLCTQSGLKLVAIESGTNAPPSHHSLDCPCLSHTLQTAEHKITLPPRHSLALLPSSPYGITHTSSYFLPPLRAPPFV